MALTFHLKDLLKMSVKFLLAISLAFGLSSGLAYAQTSGSATVRNPISGDPGTKPSRVRPSAAAVSKADKQPPGTENGNQPDRAAAGGGAR